MISTIKARHTSEVQPAEVHTTPSTNDTPCFDDVVEGEHFLEIQATVAVAIKLLEEVRVVENPFVAGLFQKVAERGVADPLITVCVHGLEERPCMLNAAVLDCHVRSMLKPLRAVVLFPWEIVCRTISALASLQEFN